MAEMRIEWALEDSHQIFVLITRERSWLDSPGYRGRHAERCGVLRVPEAEHLYWDWDLYHRSDHHGFTIEPVGPPIPWDTWFKLPGATGATIRELLKHGQRP